MIERKTFVLQDKKLHQGVVTQITKIRPSFTRTIMVPQAALQWLSKTLHTSITGQPLSVPIWRTLGVLKQKAEKMENRRGGFLTITEFLLDRRPYSLCIPKGKQSSGWTTFQTEIDAKLPPETPTPPPIPRLKPHCDTFRPTSRFQKAKNFTIISLGRTPKKQSPFSQESIKLNPFGKMLSYVTGLTPQRTSKPLLLP